MSHRVALGVVMVVFGRALVRLRCGSGRIRSAVACAALTTVLAGWCPSRALADSKDTAVGLSYQAPPGCPSMDDFLRALSARTRQVRWGGFEARRQLSVAITEGPGGFRGSLTVSKGQEPGVRRSLDNQACAALVDALALVAAMDLEFALARREETATRAPTTGARAVPERSNVGQPTGKPHRDSGDSRTSRGGRDRGYEQLIAAVGGLQKAPTPDALPTGGLHWGMQQRRRAFGFGVSVHYGQTGLLDFTSGDVRFRWLVARLFGCPLGLERGPFAVFACASAEFGVLRGEPENTRARTIRSGLWVAPGLGALASVWKAGIALELFAGLARPIQRHDFFFAAATPSGEREPVHHVPALGPIAEIRLGVPF